MLEPQSLALHTDSLPLSHLVSPSSNFTFGYFSEENKSSNFKRYMHPYGHLSIVYNTIESNLCPLTDKWIKEDVVLICNAVLFRYIKELK